MVLVGKDLVKLGNGEVGEVHQAGRVVNDQANGHAAAGVDDCDTVRWLLRARTAILRVRSSLGGQYSGSRQDQAGRQGGTG